MVLPPSITVTVTGAAGQIAYSLLPRLLDGSIFGKGVTINLHLLDVAGALGALGGVKLELEDLDSAQLGTVLATDDQEVAFAGADVAIMLGAFPRKEGMERADLLAKNVAIFAEAGKALARVGEPTCKVLVVGNPANTNAAILARNAAPTIAVENVMALTRLDHNRLHAQLALRSGVNVQHVRRAVIWGNHSSTQYPDISSTTIAGVPAVEVFNSAEDQAWLRGELIATVQTRGAAVIKARKLSSAMSAAKAIYDHLHDLLNGSNDWVSMAVPSDGSYGVPAGLVYSFPCAVKGDGTYKIVGGLEVDAFSAKMMKASADELATELADAIAASTA
ncbi:malate dehydrogenase [Pavlovales sp. CCMP2436]|nr:malate dehydrogenase [Pavlovales sp. CCMP2436]